MISLGAHHWSPISLVPRLIGPPSHWSPIPLVPQLAPMHHPFHWSPISLVPRLIGPPSHRSHISLVPQCDPDYTVLIGPPSHWSPNVTLVIEFSLVPHLIESRNGPPATGPHLFGSILPYDMSCALILLTGLYRWDSFINPSSMGPIFGVWIGPTLGAPKWTIRHWAAALVLKLFSLICAWVKRLSKQPRRGWYDKPSRSL